MSTRKIAAIAFMLCLAAPGARAVETVTVISAPKKSCRFEKGVTSLQNFECDRAIRYFSQAFLRSSPQNKNYRAQLMVMIGRAFQFDENNLAAAQSYAIANALRPDDQTISAYLADTLSRCGQAQRVKPYYDWLLAQKNKNLVALEVLAQANARISKPVVANQFLDQALADPNNKNNAHLLVMKARILAKLGLTKQSGERYKLAAQAAPTEYLKNLFLATSLLIEDNKTERENYLKAAGVALPADPMWHIDLGDLYASIGKKQSAFDEYMKAISSRRLSARAFERAANFLASEKRYDDAIRCLNYVGKMKPWASDIPFCLASTYAQRKDFKNAEDQYKRCLEMNPFSEGAYFELANCYLRDQKKEEAKQTLLRALKMCPGSPFVWSRLGDMEAESGHPEEARRDYEKTIQLTEKGTDQYNDLIRNEAGKAHAAIGTMHYANKEWPKALEAARQHNKLKFLPNLPAYLTLVKLRPGRIEEGKTEKEKEFVSHLLLADMLRQTNHLDECIAEYRKAQAINPDDMDLHSYLLDALTAKGDWFESAKEDVALSNQLVTRVPQQIKNLTNPPKSEK